SLLTLDDSYEPEQTIEATKKLIEQEEVFMLFGYVGTPTSTAAVPLAKQAQVPFFAPFTGAEFLRTPVRGNVYNVRASYFQETEAQVHQLVDVLGKKNLAVFYQNDSYGRAGLGGVQKALRQRGLDVTATGTYQRNTLEVHAALEAIQKVTPRSGHHDWGIQALCRLHQSGKSGRHAGALSECVFRRQSPLGTGTRRGWGRGDRHAGRALALGYCHPSGGAEPG